MAVAREAEAATDRRLLLLDASDDVFAVARPIAAHDIVRIDNKDIEVDRAAGIGFKLARRFIQAGDAVLKYGAVIGTATADIPAGHLVHSHNLKSAYLPSTTVLPSTAPSEIDR